MSSTQLPPHRNQPADEESTDGSGEDISDVARQSLPRTAPFAPSPATPHPPIVIEGHARGQVKKPSTPIAKLGWLVVFLANLVVLCVPTLVVLLLSPLAGPGVGIEFDSLWSYLWLSLALTTIMVIIDHTIRALSSRVSSSPKSFTATAVTELVTWMGVALTLWPFSQLFLGALLISIVVCAITGLLSRMVAQWFV